MPIYEYRCTSCGHIAEEWVKSFNSPMSEPCPACGAEAVRIVSDTSFQLKGSGWYVTDYKKSGASQSHEPSGDHADASASSDTAPDTPVADTAASGSGTAETPKSDAPKTEASRPDAPKAESAKPASSPSTAQSNTDSAA